MTGTGPAGAGPNPGRAGAGDSRVPDRPRAAREGSGTPDGRGTDDTRILVPEHEVKRLLAELGVPVPRGTAVANADGPDAVGAAARELRAPLVLKAYGPGLVHKSDVGAVRLGLDAAAVPDAARAMADRLTAHGVVPDGWLVEEQQPTGVELIVGRVRGPFGYATLLGLGGVLAESLDQAVVRLDGTVRRARPFGAEMVASMPRHEVLLGPRGTDPVDLTALARLVEAVGGPDALGGAVEAAYPGWVVDEFECNPVIATKDGAVAADARMILRRGAATDRVAEQAAVASDFGPLFAPRAIAVAGASTSKTTFGNRFLVAYRAAGWTEDLYAVHPTAKEIHGVPAVASVADIPGGVDYLLVAVPAPATPALVASAAGHARFAHVVSGGFGEAGAGDLEAELLAAARDSGVRLLGPNCLGVYAPSGRQTFQLGVSAEPGGVGVVSQSGGLAGDIVGAGTRRGLRFSGLVTIGNAIDVGAAELVEHFVDDPATHVVGMYLEGTGGGSDAEGTAHGGERLAHAVLRAAERGKPVVALVGGLSRQGARAVASHTGALAGEERMWQALAAASGMSLVRTLEDFLAVLAVLQRHPRPTTRDGVLVIGPGGGASVLATDACDRAGLAVRPLPEPAMSALRARGYGAGTSLVNPVEIPLGPATGADSFARVLETVLADTSYADVLLHVNVQSYYGYADTGAAPLLDLVNGLRDLDPGGARLSLVPRNLDCAPPADAEDVLSGAARAGVPAFRDLDQAATAIAALQQRRAPAARTTHRRDHHPTPHHPADIHPTDIHPADIHLHKEP